MTIAKVTHVIVTKNPTFLYCDITIQSRFLYRIRKRVKKMSVYRDCHCTVCHYIKTALLPTKMFLKSSRHRSSPAETCTWILFPESSSSQKVASLATGGVAGLVTFPKSSFISAYPKYSRKIISWSNEWSNCCLGPRPLVRKRWASSNAFLWIT